MKRIILIVLSLILCLSLCACGGGNYASIDLQEAVEIPESGLISKDTISAIKSQNAIAVFRGNSNGIDYEWTIFGTDISEAAEINLLVELEKSSDGIGLRFSQTGSFGFPALLSVYLDEQWSAQSATAYDNSKAFSSVSLTGSDNTILNLSLRDIPENCVIRADEIPAETAAPQKTEAETPVETDVPTADYLSAVSGNEIRVYSDGGATGQDKYFTDPVPVGMPMPVEPEDQVVDSNAVYTCTFSIECSTILNNLDMLDPDKLEMVPGGGVILSGTTVSFYEGESVFDVLQRLCQDYGIHMEASWTPIYNSAYIEGIHNLYEFDCGSLSGWMYRVNGWYPNYGCSRYQLAQGDVVEWRYTCDLGSDIGGGQLFR